MILDNLHQEAGRGGQGGFEVGAWEGSADPGAGSVCAAAPVQDRPAGDWTTPVQVQTLRQEWVEERAQAYLCIYLHIICLSALLIWNSML